MQILTCEYCKNNFTPKRTNYKNPRRFCSTKCGNASRNKKVIIQCAVCSKDTTNPRFCSSSCAATFNNLNRTKESRIKQSETLMKTLLKKKIPENNKTAKIPKIKSQKFKIEKNTKYNVSKKEAKDLLKPVGPYTRIYRNICAKSGIVFYYKSWQKFHPSVLSDRENYYRLCKFNFSISQFPLWFDGSLIEQHGWYSTPGSRKGIKNTNGVSRDHMISINYGYLNNIDPKLISHPANCQLIQHNQNNKKNINCSITIEELKQRIVEFEKLYNWQGGQASLPELVGWSHT